MSLEISQVSSDSEPQNNKKTRMNKTTNFRNADGKVYFYNSITKASSWNEPDELKRFRKEAENIDQQNGGGSANMLNTGNMAGANPMMAMMMMNMMMQNNVNTVKVNNK